MVLVVSSKSFIFFLYFAFCEKYVSGASRRITETGGIDFAQNSVAEMSDDLSFEVAEYRNETVSSDTDSNIYSVHGTKRRSLINVEHSDRSNSNEEDILFSSVSNDTSANIGLGTTIYDTEIETQDHYTHMSTPNMEGKEYITTEFMADCTSATSSICEEGTCCLNSTVDYVGEPTLSLPDNFTSSETEQTTLLAPDDDITSLNLPLHMYFNSLNSSYRKTDNGSVIFHPAENGSTFPVTYYYCTEREEKGKYLQNLRISCNCSQQLSEMRCCNSGLLLFYTGSGPKTDYWDCYEDTYVGTTEEKTEYVFANENQQDGLFPYVLLPIDYSCTGWGYGGRWEYIILKGEDLYNSSTYQVKDSLFLERYYCEKDSNETLVYLCGTRHDLYDEYYEAMNIFCTIFHSVTLVVFFLLPDIRTMKTRILICQTACFLVLNLVNLRFYTTRGKLLEVECIMSGYANHFFNLAGSFWINVLCIDMAWTFSGIRFHRADRWKFRAYSLYAWGTPLLIAILTAILGFAAIGEGSSWKPTLNMSTCWISDTLAMIIFHYGPFLFLTLLNGPLLAYAIFKISRALCASAILEKNGSVRHTGSKPTKKKKRRYVVYTNLALLMGAPRILAFIKLINDDEQLMLIINIITMLRSVSFFLFVCCRRKVFTLLKQRLSNLASLIPHIRKKQQETFKMSASETPTTATDVSSSEMQTSA